MRRLLICRRVCGSFHLYPLASEVLHSLHKAQGAHFFMSFAAGHSALTLLVLFLATIPSDGGLLLCLFSESPQAPVAIH